MKIDNSLPKDLYLLNPKYFLIKFIIWIGLIFFGFFLLKSNYILLNILGVVMLGVVFAHGIELQHECLHNNAFNSEIANAIIGVILGIPMLSSYYDYKEKHIYHHKYVGTTANKEFFQYKHSNLVGLLNFLKSTFYMGRYIQVLKNIILAYTTNKLDIKIRLEYILYSVILFFTAWWIYKNPSILIYIASILIIAEGIHFLIELPEHYGLNTQTEDKWYKNTRTIYTNRFIEWLTNYNNLHTAHHHPASVPVCNIKRFHNMIKKDIDPNVVSYSYLSFYKDVIQGKIKFDKETSCML